MTPVSAADAERARKFQGLVLQRLASVGQRHVAEQLTTSESTVSRFVSSDLERVCLVLAALGLKVVPGEMQCYPPDKIRILLCLARDHLNHLETPEQLSFD
jgi:hypothetical protein